MDAYTAFAEVYDLFMEETPYEEWCQYLTGQLSKHGITDGIVLDMGCGTGVMTELLAGQGYEMIGVDASADMLAQAFEKKEQSGHDILYLCQDMCELELYGTVRAVVCICDSLNYILEEEMLLRTFRRIYQYLEPDGLFLFDMNTPWKYETLLGDHIFAENREEGSYIWENYYDAEQKINEYAVTFYMRQEKSETCEREHYLRHEEFHYQKAYDMETIRRLLAKAGLKILHVYDNYTQNEPGKECERWSFVVKRDED